MFHFFVNRLCVFFSSMDCIKVTLAFICIVFGLLLHRELGLKDLFVNRDSSCVHCLKCDKIHIYFDAFSCMAGSFKKRHPEIVWCLELFFSVCCIHFIAGLITTHSVYFGIASVVCLISLFSIIVKFSLTACLLPAGYLLVEELVDRVMLDTDRMSLMIFCGDRLVTSTPVCFSYNFNPTDDLIEVYIGFPGQAREKAVCLSCRKEEK